MDRNEKILMSISKDMKILEIGPSLAPIASKREYQNVFTVDHASQEDLITKYQKQGLNTDAIEAVDFVWTGGPMHEAIPLEAQGSFDAVIASHVFEHIPDPITFLQSVGLLLKEGGHFSMVNPDKRYSFDFLKPIATSADMIEAYEEKRSRHSRKTVFAQYFDSVASDGKIIWAEWIPPVDIKFVDPNIRRIHFPADPEKAEYIDCHAWHFTPSSFDLLILELNAIGLIQFEVDLSFPSWGCEFYRTLRKVPAGKNQSASLPDRRLALHRQIFEEMRAQFDSWKPSSSS